MSGVGRRERWGQHPGRAQAKTELESKQCGVLQVMLLFIVYFAFSSLEGKAEEQGLVGSTGLSPLIHLGISHVVTIPLLSLEKSSAEGIHPK